MSFIINSYRFAVPTYDSERSLLFDGVNEYVSVAHDAGIQFEKDEEFTISLWVKNSSTSYGVLYSKYDEGSNIGVRIQRFTSNEIDFYLRNGSQQRRIRSTGTMNTSDWYHIVCTNDTSDTIGGMNIYIDGSSDKNTITDTLTTSINNTNIAKIGGNPGGYIDGYMDEISVWDKELTGSEITDLYNSGCPDNLNNHSASANLVSWWAIDSSDDATSSIADKAGSNTGTPNNMESGDLSTEIPS